MEKDFRTLVEDVGTYRSLKKNFDGYDGDPPPEDTVRFVADLLQWCKEQGDIPLPHIAPIDSGIYFEWRNDLGVLYFEIVDNVVGYRLNINSEDRYGDLPISPLPTVHQLILEFNAKER